MNKELEALENLCNQCEFYQYEKGLRPKKCPFDKNCVHKHRIEKALKALEIIKEKQVDVGWLMNCESINQYNNGVYVDLYDVQLTQEEYDLLKEILL